MNNTEILINSIISILAPVVVMWIKKLIPNWPKAVVLLIPVLLGALAGFLMERAGLESNVVLGVIFGALGVFVREVGDQLGKVVEAKRNDQPVPKVKDETQT